MAFSIKQNDTSPSIRANIVDYNGEPVNITGGSVRLHMKEVGGDGTLIVKNMSILDAQNGLVQYDWVVGDTADVANYNAEIQVTYADGEIETYPNAGYFSIIVTAELA